MPLVEREFTITDTIARRYIRGVEDRLGNKRATQLVRGFAWRAGLTKVRRKTGRLQRSMTVVRIKRYTYRLRYSAPYSSYVEEKYPFIDSVIRQIKRDIRTRARQSEERARASRNALPAPNPIVQLINMYRQPGLIGVPP